MKLLLVCCKDGGALGGHEGMQRTDKNGLNTILGADTVRVEVKGESIKFTETGSSGKVLWMCEGTGTASANGVTVAKPTCKYWNECYPAAVAGPLTANLNGSDLVVSVSIAHGAQRGACVAANEENYTKTSLNVKLKRGEPGAPPPGA